MSLRVYEDDITNRVRIHFERSDCFQKRKANPRPDNRWHGPYATLEEAWAKVHETGKIDADECRSWNCSRLR